MVYPTHTDIENVRTWLGEIQYSSNYEFGCERISDEKLIGSGSIGYDPDKER